MPSMPFVAETMIDFSLVFIELGAVIIGLAVLARLASRIGLSAIPLYLLAGLAFGNGGLVPLQFTQDFIHVGAEVGVILLLFMLGLEYTGEQLASNIRSALPSGTIDLLLNFPPGVIAGLIMGWSPLSCVLLGGVTYISSSGVIAKVLGELKSLDNPETPTILSILVLEDLAMAIFLPLVSVLLVGRGIANALTSVLIALALVAVVLFLALRYGTAMSRVVSHRSDEVILLTTVGLVLLVAGVAQHFHVSAAVGAFLVGIALSGPLVEQTHRLVGPLRDLSAAIFFLFFGLQIDPSALPAILLPAAGLCLVTASTKVCTGWWAARRAGLDPAARLRAGTALVARGEFSIVIAGLGVSAGLESQLGSLSAGYVLIMAVIGPILARIVQPKPADHKELVQ